MPTEEIVLKRNYTDIAKTFEDWSNNYWHHPDWQLIEDRTYDDKNENDRPIQIRQMMAENKKTGEMKTFKMIWELTLTDVQLI